MAVDGCQNRSPGLMCCVSHRAAAGRPWSGCATPCQRRLRDDHVTCIEPLSQAPALLVLADGTVLRGEAFAARGTAIG